MWQEEATPRTDFFSQKKSMLYASNSKVPWMKNSSSRYLRGWKKKSSWFCPSNLWSRFFASSIWVRYSYKGKSLKIDTIYHQKYVSSKSHEGGRKQRNLKVTIPLFTRIRVNQKSIQAMLTELQNSSQYSCSINRKYKCKLWLKLLFCKLELNIKQWFIIQSNICFKKVATGIKETNHKAVTTEERYHY